MASVSLKIRKTHKKTPHDKAQDLFRLREVVFVAAVSFGWQRRQNLNEDAKRLAQVSKPSEALLFFVTHLIEEHFNKLLPDGGIQIRIDCVK